MEDSAINGEARIDAPAIAAEALAALASRAQIAPFSSRLEAFGLDEAYRVADLVRRLRERRGERPVGRKIGFTNRNIWAEYGVYAPVWSHVYDTTVRHLGEGGATVVLDGFVEPRIEPEIVFKLAAAPAPDMTEAALIACIDWVAHGVEIVQSIFPGWRFAAVDTIVGFGLHGALLIGPPHKVAPRAAEWSAMLRDFDIDLWRDGSLADRGRAAHVLGGPVSALRHLVDLLARDASQPRLATGEIVTTGTLTRAFPVAPGQAWATSLAGIPLDGLRVRFE